MQSADVVLYIFDVNEMHADDLFMITEEFKRSGKKYLLVGNKIDLAGEGRTKEKFSDLENIVFISAKEHLHTEVLKDKMVDAVLKGRVQTEYTIITNARHYHALKEVQKSLLDIKQGLNKELPGDLLALDIRRCLHYLGEITGEISNEDMLDYIFSKFCIGK